MLNEELIAMQDPRIVEIAKLRHAIEAFKKYDKKRKEFVQKLQTELEDVSEQYCELRHNIPKDVQEIEAKYKERLSKLKATVKGQNKKIEEQQKTINLLKNPDVLKRAEEVLKKYTVVELKKANEVLQKKLDILRKTNEELIAKQRETFKIRH